MREQLIFSPSPPGMNAYQHGIRDTLQHTHRHTHTQHMYTRALTHISLQPPRTVTQKTVFQSVLPMCKSNLIIMGYASQAKAKKKKKNEMLVPLHLKHKSLAGASACQPVIHSLLEWVGVERRRRKWENACRRSLGLRV